MKHEIAAVRLVDITGKQELHRTDFGSRLLAAEGDGEVGAVRVRGERTGVGEGKGCV